VLSQDGAIKEIVFVMTGKFKIGFFDLIEEYDQSKHWWHDYQDRHWHEFNRGEFNWNINVISDYSMFYGKRSDIAYLCTQDI